MFLSHTRSEVDPGFLEMGFLYIKVCVCVGGGWVALPILSHFS